MRKVVYFYGGHVADFSIPDELYDAFAERSVELSAGPGEHLEPARQVLQNVMEEFSATGEARPMGESEVVAACYIWHYFNTTDEQTRIEDDILIVDADGESKDVQYVPLSEVDLVQEE